MSFNIVKEKFAQEIPAGIRLCIVNNIQLYKDKKTQEPIKQNGSFGIIFEFKDGENKLHQEVFWLEGFNKKKMELILSNIDCPLTEQGVSKKEALNKRVWLYIREILTVNGHGEIVEKSKRIFDSARHSEGGFKPVNVDDPDRNRGNLQGEFVRYNHMPELGQDVEEAKPVTLGATNVDAPKFD